MTDFCFFCGQKARGITAGIALNLDGHDYHFCFKCLREKTALELMRAIFKDMGLAWPPKMAKGNSSMTANTAYRK